MNDFLWEQCLKEGVDFGRDIVFACLGGPTRTNLQHITANRYTRITWDDQVEAQRPETLLKVVLRKSPRARLFLFDYYPHLATRGKPYRLQRDALVDLLRDPSLRLLLLQEPRQNLVLGSIHDGYIELAPPKDGEALLREFEL